MEKINIFQVLENNDKIAFKSWFQSAHDLNEKNENGESVLIKAVQKNQKRFIQDLCSSSRVDINIVDNFGKTAMDYGVEMRQPRIFRLLMQKSGKISQRENLEYLVKWSRFWKRIFVGLGLIALFTGIPALVLGVGAPLVLTGGFAIQQSRFFSNLEKNINDYFLIV